MARLQDLAAVLRSKNAGPFQITIDLMFDDEKTFHRVCDSNVLTPERVGTLYGVSFHAVRIMPFAKVRAIKVTMPRRWGTHGSGSAFDRDVLGAQQHGPLAELEIP